MIRKSQFAGDSQAISFADQFYVMAGQVHPLYAAATLRTENYAVPSTTRQNPLGRIRIGSAVSQLC